METVAGNYLRAGDLANAAQLYTSLEHLNPRYARMARCCRVLNEPAAVPLPHRHQDVCEALLEPSMPPEILVGEELSIDAVQKRYQRLVLHVHPDKNPHPQAADAFLRLGELREKAVALVEQKCAEKAARDAARRLPAGVAMNKAKRKKGALPPDTAPPQHGPLTGPSADMPNLAELRKARITLSSLKRKDIDDEALSDTLLSSTQRHARRTDVEDDGDSVAAQLASTAPDMATHRLHSTAPARLHKDVRVRPTSHNGKRLAPLKGVSASPWIDAAPTGRDLLALRAGAVPRAACAVPRKPTSPRPTPAPTAHIPSEDAVIEEVGAAVREAEVARAADVTPEWTASVPAEAVADTAAAEANLQSPVSVPEWSVPVEETQPEDAEGESRDNTDDEDPLAALREHISSLINRVGTMKRNSGGIRLTTDLSYASYERRKEASHGAADDGD